MAALSYLTAFLAFVSVLTTLAAAMPLIQNKEPAGDSASAEEGLDGSHMETNLRPALHSRHKMQGESSKETVGFDTMSYLTTSRSAYPADNESPPPAALTREETVVSDEDLSETEAPTTVTPAATPIVNTLCRGKPKGFKCCMNGRVHACNARGRLTLRERRTCKKLPSGQVQYSVNSKKKRKKNSKTEQQFVKESDRTLLARRD